MANKRGIRERREAETVQMYEDRKAGMTLQEIGDKFGITKGAVFNRIRKYSTEIVETAADSYRDHEIEKLDEMETKLWEIVGKKHYRVDHGKLIVLGQEGEEEVLSDDEPIMKAIDRLLKVMERRAKLLGLDNPVKQDVNVSVETRDEELLGILDQVRKRNEDIVEAEVVEDVDVEHSGRSGAPLEIEGGQ